MGREFELKYRAKPAVLDVVQARFGSFAPIDMETAYYDTPSRELSRRRWTLRRRYENGTSVCTVKIPLADGSRGEWEICREDILAAIPELCKLGAPDALELLSREGLVEVCAARFTRLAAKITLPDCVVELALDRGVLLGGGGTLPFAELEVELKAGSEAAAAAFARSLAAEFRLEPEPKSKQQRALELA